MPDVFAQGLRSAGWLAGLPALALIWASATLYAAPQIAETLEAAGARVAAGTATATGEPWLRLEARGRDLAAEGEAPDVGERETVLAKLAALEGPRRIVSEVGLVETATPFQWAAIRTGTARVALEGSRPVEIGRRALEARITGALAPGTYLDDTARAARGAPPDFASAAAFLAARLSGLAKGGRAAVSDTVLNLSGEALDVPAYEALRSALANPPAGFSIGRIEIVPPAVAQFRFAVEKSARGIVLDGFAPSAADREAALRAAAEAVPGGTVQDRLLTARGLDPAIDPKALIGFAFKLAELIQAGTVTFAEDTIAVTGDAIDAQAIPDAAALMREARPAGVKAGRVALAARPLSPYRVAIRRTPEAVTLTGHLPDDATRERVLAALRPRLFREPVVDRTRLADGAPPDLGTALAAAAPLVVNLAIGEVTVSDRALTLTGESLYREAAARLPDRLAEALPAGWTGQAAVSARQPAETRDPAACRAEAAATLDRASLRFPAGSATLAPTFYPVLDALAALAKACPTLRIAVSAPADPAKPKPAPGEGAAPTETPTAMAAPHEAPAATGSAPKPNPKPDPQESSAKPAAKLPPAPEPHAAAKKAEPAKPAAAKPAGTKTPPTQKAEKKPKEAADDPPLDLPRLRAQAVIEYLLQAGVRPDQVSAGPDAPAGPVAFALLP
ncbi:outer membrane protein OmpA-like peptidoglycan-associated protein [Methylobacterium brachiatum]|uniref:Outer membrane protein OmpA-like peptidoglycan-associated protein n=1 Tax=Methylobacterium brachiatum TaxID=269660 RepID=A0AAJ1TLW5_9HYPH|nr:outer membrane protein OmpA-like peptidoglycan-associated protein [Methylobacterium brachiatum]